MSSAPPPTTAMPTHWVFGYGSLIWRPDFPYLARHPARLAGYARRFWQGSHDHRGVPAAPGRVVTLIEETDASTDGVVYGLAAEVYAEVVAALDHREQNGYAQARRAVELLRPNSSEARRVEALVYIATPANPAFLGAAPLAVLATQIATARGPSGSNRDYLFALAEALRELGAVDAHVFDLEQQVRRLERLG